MDYSTLCISWVPKILTDVHMQKCLAAADAFLQQYWNEGGELYNHCALKWIVDILLECSTKQHSVQWWHSSFPKAMIITEICMCSIIFLNFLVVLVTEMQPIPCFAWFVTLQFIPLIIHHHSMIKILGLCKQNINNKKLYISKDCVFINRNGEEVGKKNCI